MNCRAYKKLLHLNKEGELTRREETRLSRHLQTCKACARDQKNIHRADELLLASASARPLLPEPDEFTRSVMARVRQLTTSHPQRKMWAILIQRLFDAMGGYRARLATAAVLLIAVGTFMVEEFTLLNDIRSLERKMALPIERRDATVSYCVTGEQLNDNLEIGHLHRNSPIARGGMAGDSLVVSDRAFKSLLGQFRSAPFRLLQLQSVLGMEHDQPHAVPGRPALALSVRIHIPLERM